MADTLTNPGAEEVTNVAAPADEAFDPQADAVTADTGSAGFDTPDGTRGDRSPRPFEVRLQKWVDGMGGTRIGRRIYRRLMGCDSLMLTTIGRKSGIERNVRIACFPDRVAGNWLIVAAAGGTAANPAWYRNIAAHPDRVTIEFGGRRTAVTAEQLHGAERTEAWRQIVAVARQFARFQEKTDRELPVIRLTPRSGSQA